MRLFLIFLLLITIPAFAQDKVRVQIEFAKYRYTCPLGHKYLTDTNKEIATCPVCGAKSGEGSYTEYHGVIYKSLPDYEKWDSEKQAADKQEKLDAWIYDIDHPPVYVEPLPEEIQSQIDDKLREIESLQAQKVEIEAKKIIPIIIK